MFTSSTSFFFLYNGRRGREDPCHEDDDDAAGDQSNIFRSLLRSKEVELLEKELFNVIYKVLNTTHSTNTYFPLEIHLHHK